MKEGKYYRIDYCRRVVLDPFGNWTIVNECSNEDIKKAYMTLKSEGGLVVGESYIQIHFSGNGKFSTKNIIIGLSRTSIKEESAEEVYGIRRNQNGGNRKGRKKTDSD